LRCRFGSRAGFHINSLVGAAATLLLGTFLIWHLQKGGTITTEVAIGVIFTAALAVGILVTPSEDLIEALFGGFQSLTLPWFLMGDPVSGWHHNVHLDVPPPTDYRIVLA
jgi:ABC-type Mn2+/Zn2+ transport system permease subunit